jgi:predicted site-specific integrase-resolvase
VEPDLISVAEAAHEFNLSTAALFKYLRQGKIKRWRRTGDRRTFVERGELKKLLQPRVVKG